MRDKMRTDLKLSNKLSINLREIHFQSKEQAGNKSCIVVTIFNAACTLGEEDGGIGNITIHHAVYRRMRKNTFFVQTGIFLNLIRYTSDAEQRETYLVPKKTISIPDEVGIRQL